MIVKLLWLGLDNQSRGKKNKDVVVKETSKIRDRNRKIKHKTTN